MMSTTLYIIIITAVVSFICFRNAELFEKLALKPYRIFHNGEIYRAITHGFVHADFTHLLVNMFTFYFFGPAVEYYFGELGFTSWTFLLLYFGGMIVASLSDIIRYRNNSWFSSIGASGAVSAVLFTSIFFNPWGRLYFFALIPIPGIVFGVLYLVYCQYMARRNTGDYINHNAHFYGALFGILLPILLKPSLLRLFFQLLFHPSF